MEGMFGETGSLQGTEAHGHGWEPGRGLLCQGHAHSLRAAFTHRAQNSPRGALPDPPAHVVAAGRCMAQASARCASSRWNRCRWVCSSQSVLPHMSAVDIEAQHISAVPAGRHSTAEVGLQHIGPQARTSGRSSGGRKTPETTSAPGTTVFHTRRQSLGSTRSRCPTWFCRSSW